MRNKSLMVAVLFAAVSAFPQATEIGKCDGCGPNEASAYVAFEVGPGDYVYENDTGCDQDTDTAISMLVNAYAESQVPGASVYAGPILNEVATQLGNAVKANVGGTLGEWSQAFTGQRTANCAILSLAVPAGAKYTGYRYEAREAGGEWMKCAMGMTDCPIGWSAFRQAPQISWTANGGVAVTTSQEIGSHNSNQRCTIHGLLRATE